MERYYCSGVNAFTRNGSEETCCFTGDNNEQAMHFCALMNRLDRNVDFIKPVSLDNPLTFNFFFLDRGSK